MSIRLLKIWDLVQQPPEGYHKIRVHIIFAVKHDGRHKCRCVADGHLTSPTKEGSYSGVVSLRSLRIILTVAELNGLKTMVGDIGNAYLEATTKEKVWIIAGPEFDERQGNTLIIKKALYGLRTSGARFHEKLAETLRTMGFIPCYADSDVWLRDMGTHYDYVCTYVDDLCACMSDPQKFYDDLQKDPWNYKLSGVGEPKYHLGGDFGRDPDGTLTWGPKKYIEKILDNYLRTFGELPVKRSSPMEPKDSPEIDVSAELDEEGVTLYQSLIGGLQWAVTLGRFDIMVAVMAMSRFRINPRTGHLERLKRVYGYLRKCPDAKIRFRTGIPANEKFFTVPNHDWMHSVYETEVEDYNDYPTPRGKVVRLTTFKDANLMHCKVTGKSCTGILHMLNQTPIEWFSKRQNTVETATYGSEFVAARQATEQIMDITYTLKAMGVPMDGPTWLLGDNESVITSSTIPHSQLGKRHNALSYHRVREAVAAGVLYFCKISGVQNPSDVLTKYLPYATFWPLVQPFLFWHGETAKESDFEIEKEKSPKGAPDAGSRGVTN